MRSSPRYSALLALSLLLAACPSKDQKELQTLAEAGSFEEAATKAVALIQADPEDTKAKETLASVAEPAYDARMDRARELEAAGKLEESLAAYDEAKALREKLGAYVDIPDEGIDEEIDKVRKAAATERFQRGETAFKAKQWSKALSEYAAAQELKKDWTDAGRQRVEAFRRWAHEDVENARYRDAIAHFDEVYNLSGDKEAQAWSATIHAALGRYALHRGACRAAAEELRAAQPLPYDPTLGTDLAKAEKCARREVIIQPFEELAHEDLGGAALTPMLGDHVLQKVRDQGTEFLALLDAQSPGKKAPESIRYEVRGRLTQVRVERPEPTTQQRATRGKTMVQCVMAATEWEEGEKTHCEDEVDITYIEKAQYLRVHLAGSVRVVYPETGEQVMTTPFTATEEVMAGYADNFVFVDSDGSQKTASVGKAPAIGVVVVDPAIAELAEGPPPMPNEADIAQKAVNKLADQAVIAILDVVDKADYPPDPSHLTLDPPVMDASGVRFGEAEVDVKLKDPPVEDLPQPVPMPVPIEVEP